MSMPIQRQSEAYNIFDDGPRFARDRSSTDLPSGLAGLVNSMGPRIQAGLLNTRTASGDFHNMEIDDVQDLADSGHPGARSYLEKFYEKPEGYFTDESYSGPGVPDRANNPHTAGWHTPDYDPRVDGYGGGHYGPSAADMADFAEEDAENERRRNYPRGQGAPWDYDKYGDPDPDLESLENTADPERFISGNRQASRRPFDRAAARRQAACQECGRPVFHISGEGFVHHDTDDGEGWKVDEHHEAWPDAEDEQGLALGSLEGWHEQRRLEGSFRTAKDGECTCWEGYERVPGTEPCASGSCRKKTSAADIDWRRARPGPMVDVPLRRQDPEDYFGWVEDDSDTCPTCNRSVRYVSGPHCRHGNLHTAAEAPMDPAQMQVPMGGGYQIGHRVGLPWRNQVIPGTVIGLDGSSVVTRWDDGQYSTEEPHNIQLL